MTLGNNIFLPNTNVMFIWGMVLQKYSGTVKNSQVLHSGKPVKLGPVPRGPTGVDLCSMGVVSTAAPLGSHRTNEGLSAVGLHLQLCQAGENTPPRETQALPASITCMKTTHRWNTYVCDAKTCPKLLSAAGSLEEASPGRGSSKCQTPKEL